MDKSLMARWRASVLTGFAVVRPTVLRLATVNWLWSAFSGFTDPLLLFLPRQRGPGASGQDGVLVPVCWHRSWLTHLIRVGALPHESTPLAIT